MDDSATMPVCERFVSLQGEGIWLGVPSAFLRFAGCNLACRWCDTPYASRAPLECESIPMAELVAWATADPAVRHVVLTGGEPMLQPMLPELARQLAARDRKVTIETNGTIPPAGIACDLASLSPKLRNSGHGGPSVSPCPPPVARQWLAHCPCQLKFVIQEERDLDDVREFLGELDRGVQPEHVFLMPEGRRPEEIAARTEMLVRFCLETGFRYGRRLQLDLFGDTRGT